jgi:hypothetical protein
MREELERLFAQALKQETACFNAQDFMGRNFYGGQANAYSKCLELLKMEEE